MVGHSALMCEIYAIIVNSISKPGCLRILTLLLALIISTAGATRPVVKTIQISNGDIIDCVDIYKQPAFDHPFLKKHKIEATTTRRSYTDEVLRSDSSTQYAKIKCEECRNCPDQTIPILRIRGNGMMHPTQPHSGKRPEAAAARMINNDLDSWYDGVSADISVWKPIVPAADYSIAQIGVESENHEVGIYAGWTVFPSLFQDFESRSFISWKVKDGNQTRGCINLACPGFVQISHSIVLGGQLPVSTSNGSLSIIDIKIKKHRNDVWWVVFNGVRLGYWTYKTLNAFAKARVLRWAGRVKNQGSGPEARTQMGNGHFASDGFGNAAHFGSMKYRPKNSYKYVAAENIQIFTTLPHCYTIIKHPQTPLSVGPMVLYGGPGGPNCY